MPALPQQPWACVAQPSVPVYACKTRRAPCQAGCSLRFGGHTLRPLHVGGVGAALPRPAPHLQLRVQFLRDNVHPAAAAEGQGDAGVVRLRLWATACMHGRVRMCPCVYVSACVRLGGGDGVHRGRLHRRGAAGAGTGMQAGIAYMLLLHMTHIMGAAASAAARARHPVPGAGGPRRTSRTLRALLRPGRCRLPAAGRRRCPERKPAGPPGPSAAEEEGSRGGSSQGGKRCSGARSRRQGPFEACTGHSACGQSPFSWCWRPLLTLPPCIPPHMVLSPKVRNPAEPSLGHHACMRYGAPYRTD